MCFIRANETAHLVNGQREQLLSAVSGQDAEIKSVCLHICFPSIVMLKNASVYLLVFARFPALLSVFIFTYHLRPQTVYRPLK